MKSLIYILLARLISLLLCETIYIVSFFKEGLNLEGGESKMKSPVNLPNRFWLGGDLKNAGDDLLDESGDVSCILWFLGGDSVCVRTVSRPLLAGNKFLVWFLERTSHVF